MSDGPDGLQRVSWGCPRRIPSTHGVPSTTSTFFAEFHIQIKQLCIIIIYRYVCYFKVQLLRVKITKT
jgi:hypothetical protein